MCVWLLNADDSRLRRYVSASVIDETAVWETRCRHQSASAFRHEFAVSGSPHESDALIVSNVGSGVDWFSLGPMDAVQFHSELLPSWPLRFTIKVVLIGIIVKRRVVDHHELSRARRATGCSDNLSDEYVSVHGGDVRVILLLLGYSVVQQDTSIRI